MMRHYQVLLAFKPHPSWAGRRMAHGPASTLAGRCWTRDAHALCCSLQRRAKCNQKITSIRLGVMDENNRRTSRRPGPVDEAPPGEERHREPWSIRNQLQEGARNLSNMLLLSLPRAKSERARATLNKIHAHTHIAIPNGQARNEKKSSPAAKAIHTPLRLSCRPCIVLQPTSAGKWIFRLSVPFFFFSFCLSPEQQQRSLPAGSSPPRIKKDVHTGTQRGRTCAGAVPISPYLTCLVQSCSPCLRRLYM